MVKLKKGVLVSILYGIVCFAKQSQTTSTAQDLINELFEGVEHSVHSSIKHIRFIDPQTFIEEYELGEHFRSLSPQEKDQFVETIELLNTLFAHVVTSLVTEELDKKAS